MLVQRKADIEELKDLFGDEFVDFNLVFCSSNGKPIEGQVMVPIPVDGEGNISLSLQKEIAQKFISVQNSQKEIIEKLDALISKKISI